MSENLNSKNVKIHKFRLENLQKNTIFLDRMGLVVVNNFQTLHCHCLIHYRTIGKYRVNLLWLVNNLGKHGKISMIIFRGWFVSTWWSNLNLSSSRFCICILTFDQLIDQLDKLESMWSSYMKKCLLHSPKHLKMDNLPTIFENFFPSNQHGIHGKVKQVEKSLLKLKRFSLIQCYTKHVTKDSFFS